MFRRDLFLSREMDIFINDYLGGTNVMILVRIVSRLIGGRAL